MRRTFTALVLSLLIQPLAYSNNATLNLGALTPDSLTLVYNRATSGSTSFCAATLPEKELLMEAHCTGATACTDEYTLAGAGGAVVPVYLSFTDAGGRPTAFEPSETIENINSQPGSCNNINNTRSVAVSLANQNIDWTKAPYKRVFELIFREEGSSEEARRTFTVSFGEKGIIQVNGLKDLDLSHNNSWQDTNNQVCVVSSTPTYSLTASSKNNGLLKQGNHSIAYKLQYKANNDVWKNISLSNHHSGLTASNYISCSDGVYLGIRAKVQEVDLLSSATGNYSDTITVVVEAG